jgi:O-antigen chain-terminating methyltransferase
MPAAVDIDAVMAEVRERVRRKRESGVYGAEVDAMLQAPLPGGPALFVDELADPLAVLPAYLGGEVRYDPRSTRGALAPLITYVRRSLIWLLRWWMQAVVERQDRINRLIVRELQDLDARSTLRLETRVRKLEEDSRRRRVEEYASNLHPDYFAATFSGDERVIREQDEQFVPLFAGRKRVLDLGSGRGTFLDLMRTNNIGAYGVELDERLVASSRAKGFEIVHADAEDHLRQLPDRSLDGIFAAHFAEHLEPGKLIEVLRQCIRVLEPGAPLVMATPNPRTLTVGAHSFWFDPSHRRPIPPELFEFYLKVEGFTDVEIRTYARSERRLREDVPEGPIRENVRTLNEALFGDRDYAVIGRAPAGA